MEVSLMLKPEARPLSIDQLPQFGGPPRRFIATVPLHCAQAVGIALRQCPEHGAPRKVFFVPATINYLLTLEAETLIDDFLQDEGKARYIIEDDESTQWGRVGSFVRKLLGLDAGCVVRFSHPLDCFGNTVDEDGLSHDARGRVVDAVGYLTGLDGRVEAVERPDVLALDVDVDKLRDLAVADDLRAERREAVHEVVEQLADVRAARENLARAADFLAQHRWDPDHAHACVGLPEQNST